MNAPFDWRRLEREFQQATPLPGPNAVGAGHADWWSHWHKHLATRPAPDWFYTPEDAPAFFGHHWPALTRCWVTSGEALLADLVHGDDWRPGRLANGDVDWGANPTRSMSWAGFHYWSWANPLIRAYALTGDDRFVTEISGHLASYFGQVDSFTPQLWDGAPERDDWRDWVVHNDLSAGIKMATFAEALMVFRRAPAWTADDVRHTTLLLLRLAERLFTTYRDADHADLLRTLNFLTSGGAGLGTVAAILPECGWSATWLELAQRILEVHVTELYYPDGGHRELCTQYHKAGLRDILFFEHVLMAQGRTCLLEREPYRTRLRSALRWLTAVLLPDGTTAVLNSAAASDDWLVSCLVANRALRDPQLAWHVSRSFTPDYVPRQKSRPALVARILGTGDAPDPQLPAASPEETSMWLPDSGLAVLRDGWETDASCMVVDFGRPVGGHAYPARGSFSLALRGRLAAQSPGSPHAYTDPDYRGWMHTSRSQNAVLIDDADQAQWRFEGQRVWGEVLLWETDAEMALVQGRHDGYGGLGLRCTRTVYLLYGAFFLVHDVVDAGDAGDDHVARWSLQCPEPMRETDGRVATAPGLLRVEPAWPQRIDAVETGSQGKAVWPAASEDGAKDAHRRLHQVRWRSAVPAGGRCEFLMLLTEDGSPWRLGSTTAATGQLIVEVHSPERTHVARLPLT